MTLYKGRLENDETGDVFYPQTLEGAPAGAHDMYKVGEYMIYTDKNIYKCIQDTNFSPSDYPQAWKKQ